MSLPSRVTVQIALGALRENELLAIMLAMRSDLTYQEIARLLGAPERDVLQAIQSGLRCLAAELTRQPTPVE